MNKPASFLLCSGGMVRLFLPALLALTASAAVPERFISRGSGGGGAFFGPAINPFVPDELWIGSDMSDLFVSRDSGRIWDTVDFRVLQGGNQGPRVAFTSDPKMFYGLNGGTVARSFDGGRTWTNVPSGQSSYVLFADPAATNRLVVSDYSTFRISTNAGITFSPRWTNSNGLLIGGVFWDGPRVYVGSQDGLLLSTNGGASFALTGSGIAAGEAMVSFAGAKEGGALRFFCVTWVSADVYPGIQGSGYGSYQKVYRLDGGTGAWNVATNGLGANQLFAIAMCPTNIGTAYLAGSDGAGQPSVVKTVNGGASWTQVMNCTANANVATGWSGDDAGAWNWKKWSFGECAMGFAVCATDPQRAVITDFGFVHATTNGGATWRQAYVWEGHENAAGAATPKTTSYAGNGLEDTSCWWMDWFDSNTVFAGFTDIRGMWSTNAGRSWMSPMSLPYNSTYQTVRHPGGTIFAAGSSVHDLYAWDQYCRDSRIDAGSGAVLFSTNNGASWAVFKNLGRPVVGLALDPNNTNALYATMVHSVSGGVYRTTNLAAGLAATWTKLAAPPRTEGHPYLIRVLNDGTLICSYSARITTDFTASAGVFVSTNAGASWLDRSDAGMRYYTKDVVIDPADPAQNRWYAGVWGEWGSSSGLGGLYVTTNRGVAWTRWMSGYSVGSCTAGLADTNELYVTTENDGLWYSTNRFAASPSFAAHKGYPFRFPSRVFLNPHDPNEVWVTSFGNGLRLGRRVEPAPTVEAIVPGPAGSARVRAAPGQRVTLLTSPDLSVWTAGETRLAAEDWVQSAVVSTGAMTFAAARAE